MKKLFGFELSDLSSWNKFVKLMNRPEDPSSLAIFRICFGICFVTELIQIFRLLLFNPKGILMMIDIPNERGMAEADIEYGTPTQCNFPLFDSLKPLPVQWMVVLYGIMFLGKNFYSPNIF
jgi:vitamin K-dependent gamma-carboxylase